MTCGKFCYPSYRKAAETANRQNRDRSLKSRTVHRVQVYHCSLCGAHHVTGFNN